MIFDDFNKIDKKYDLIYADPPWSYFLWNKNTQKSVTQHYQTMSKDDIINLPIQNICKDNCILCLWVTFPCLKQGLETMEKWGFEYKTCLLNWVKLNKNNDNLFLGMGSYSRANSEICLLGVKGKPLPRLRHDIRQVIISHIEEHSKKPSEARIRIEQLFGEVEKIELFSREEVEGWDSFGNQVKPKEF